MNKLVQTISEHFPNLIYCGIVDKRDTKTYDLIQQSFNSTIKVDNWLNWIKSSKKSISYSRIHVGNNIQLFVRKIDENRHLFIINEEENTTQLISFLMELKIDSSDVVISSAPNISKKSEDPKLLEAVRIQNMIIPKEEDIKQHFKNFFVVHQQQDVVGGDFYWYYRKDDRIYLALVDCTGHSLEGAMTSMIANTILNQMKDQMGQLSPKELLIKFYEQINDYNEKSVDESGNYGVGAEVGLFEFDYDKQLISFSSTGIPAFIKYNDRIELLKSKKIIEFDNLDELLINETIEMKDVLGIYSFTDGVTDQFDSEDRKKLGRRGIQRIIEEEGTFDSSYYLDKFNTWRGDNMQYDDMTFMALAI
ncbi:MAG: hypothetical protein CMB80_15835 [Flammeovirgaceae bacterium]|nr:hypothetical protein [Flammeovirgaceae bacterium]